MKYVDGFREAGAADFLRRAIADKAARLEAHIAERGPIRIMEVCGSHTMAIARYAIRDLLPDGVRLLSGPGCPVCVTDPGYIDAALALAADGGILVTFGDMIRVPGTGLRSLASARAEGADVRVTYSPTGAIAIARDNPDRNVVFLAIGFETTAAPILGMLQAAERAEVPNLSLLVAFKQVPPALRALLDDPEVAIDGLLCPAHVSAIIGADAYRPFAERDGVPCVVAGFEPLDILYGIDGLLEQWLDGAPRVQNQYERVVRPQGNRKALALMERYLEPVDASWRGIGMLPASGLALRPEWGRRNAELVHEHPIRPGKPHARCRCGEVLQGRIDPPDCALFGRGCTPLQPLGPCMVSSEGSCAAWYRYSGGGAA